MNRIIKILLKLCAMTILASLISVSALAAPAFGGGVQYTQPSGQTFTASTGGDEWFNYTAASTGYLIEKGSDSYWYYTIADKDGTVKPGTEKVLIDAPPADALTTADVSRLREQKLSTYQSTGPSKAPQFGPQQAISLPSPTGNQKILVLLVSFSDRKIVENTETAWSNAFFGPTGSVASYYTEVSGNNLTFKPAQETFGVDDGVVSVTLDYDHPKPGDKIDNSNRQIVADALVAANGSVDFASYDTNKSGYIESSELKIVTIVAGYEAACGASSPSVWAHRWSLGGAGATVAAPQLDGVSLCDVGHNAGYTQLGELHGVAGNSHMATIGTICHELGHDLGLPDLYNTVDGSLGVGDFSLMGSGNWCFTGGNAPGSSPTHLEAWSKTVLGWVTPTVPATGTHTLNSISSISSGYNVLKIPTSDPMAEEYFLLEFRGFGGYDAGLENVTTAPGIAVWHIDDGTIQAKYDNDAVNGDETHKGVDLEEAEGTNRLDNNTGPYSQYEYLFRFGANAVFGPTSPSAVTNSKLYDGTNTYIKFSVTGDTDSTSTILLSSTDARITAGTLAEQTISANFTGGETIAASSELTVTVPYAAKDDAALALTTSDENATVNYVLSASQPGSDAAYTGTYAADTKITVANGNVLWLLVTAQDGSTKLYYKVTVTVPPASTDATITAGTLAGQTISDTVTGVAEIANSSELMVTVPYAAKDNAVLALTKGDAYSIVKYVKSASQPAKDDDYTGTYAAGNTSITVADGDVLWLLVTAQDGATKLYYKITVTIHSTNATITAGTLAGQTISGTFTGGADIVNSWPLTVTVPDTAKDNAVLALTKGDANSTVKYILSASQPENDAAYTSTYTAGNTSITVADGDVLWLLVTAQDGSTKLYYKITVTIHSTNATITAGTLAGQTISGIFTGGADIVNSSPLTVTVPDASKTNAALTLTKGDTNSSVKYVKSTLQPTDDAAYTGTYTAGNTSITVADGDVIWLLVTAENGTTKLYYKLTATVTAPVSGGGGGGVGGGGGGVGGGGTTQTNTATSEFIKGDTLNISVGATVSTDSGTTNAALSNSGLDVLISHATAAAGAGKNAALEVRITGTEKSDSVNLTMTGKQFSEIAEKTQADFSVSTGIGTVTFGNSAVNAISSAAGGKDVTISIEKVNPSSLSEDARKLVNDRPVYDFSVKAGNRPISSFDGSSVTVSVPYTLKPGEDPNNIVVYYISDSGVLTAVNTCVFDSATGKVSFITDHFSQYAVAYKDIRFSDVSGWYADSVNYLAARGIVAGVGDSLFKPEDNITRAQFVTMLANLSGDDLSAYNHASFSDVKTTDWYFKTVQWAYEHKIVIGAADKFSPNDYITRQDIVTILQRYADSTGYKLPETTEAKTLTDGDQIAPYAANAVAVMQRAGIISGMSDGRFAPTSSATRSEAAKMLAIFMKDMFV